MNSLPNKRQRLENNDNCSTSAALVPQPLASFGRPGGSGTISFFNGGNALNDQKWKMQSLEAKVGNLEAEKNCLELKMQDMREEFTMRLATLEQKHQEEIAELKAKITEKNQSISETPKITKEKDIVKVKSEPTIQTNHQETVEFQPNILQSRHPQLQLLDKGKRSIGNPDGNKWNGATTLAIIFPDGLNVINSKKGWYNVYAMKGFPTFMVGNSHNTTIYYYEVKCNNAGISKKMKFRIGLSDGYLNNRFLVGDHLNTYALQLPHSRPGTNNVWICGQKHQIKLPTPEGEGDVAIIPPTPKRNEPGDVYGFGLVLSPQNTLVIFVTLNGTLICNQISISCSVDCLYPSVGMCQTSIEANFGSDPAKPFLYDIQKCPGMVFK